MPALLRLNWLQRITLIFFVVVVVNLIVTSTTEYALIGGDLFIILLIIFGLLLVLTLVRPLMRWVLWRVRNRLLVTYFLIGVLPLVLVGVIGLILAYALSGSMAAYLAQLELNGQLDRLELNARQLAEDIDAGRRRASPAELPIPAIVQSAGRTIVGEGPLRTIPSWSRPGFKGVVRTESGSYFLTAHAETGAAGRQVEVFAYTPLDNKAIAALTPGFANIQVFRARDFGVETIAEASESPVLASPVLDSTRVARVQVPEVGARGAFPLRSVRSVETGKTDEHAVSVVTRPTLMLDQLLSTLGTMRSVAIIEILSIVGVLLVVDLIAIASGVRLTRTLTRTIHDLYTGTKKVETGDFSHRIPVRTKDQLSELASSFNSMTQRVERMLEDVKEKEKLEAELEIARHVQSQLFPKEVPKLHTLELTGVCKPARVVSGDYYDFIPIDSQATAIVIGDISGKGISAALLMASLQSALHAQLKMGANGGLSTATLVDRLNRQLYESTPPEKYATFYCGIYDDHSGLLAYTNAGHVAPILIRQGQPMKLESNGMVVGMFPEFPYEQAVIQLQSGDLLSAFTDGVTECENPEGEQFGEERLTSLLLRHRDRPLEEIVRAITDAVHNWASDIDGQDDTTILLARRF